MSEVQQIIETASNKWMQAWVDRNTAVLEEALAPDFALIVSAKPSQRLERAQWLSTACSRYVASSFSYREIQVRELGPRLAVMSSIAEFTAEIDGVPRNGPLFLVDVWRRDEAGWRVCARFSSAPEGSLNAAEAVTQLR